MGPTPLLSPEPISCSPLVLTASATPASLLCSRPPALALALAPLHPTMSPGASHFYWLQVLCLNLASSSRLPLTKQLMLLLLPPPSHPWHLQTPPPSLFFFLFFLPQISHAFFIMLIDYLPPPQPLGMKSSMRLLSLSFFNSLGDKMPCI